MNHAWSEIAERLREEISEYGALLRLFEEQQRHLFCRDSDAVLRLSADIEAQVRVLHDSRGRREQAVSAFAVRHGRMADATLRSLFPLFAAEVQPLIGALMGEINVLIHRVRRASRHNHLLLARAVEIHQQLLRQLLPDSFTQTYAASGRVSVATNVPPSPALRAAG